jgi:putative MATE family efflux protein
VVGASYNLVDAIFVGFLGPEALAALAVAHPLMSIYRSIGMAIAVGTSSLISRSLGAGKKEEVNRAAGNSISLFFIVCALMTAICLPNLSGLLQLFGAEESVLPPAMSYMTVETWFMALDFFLIVLAELARVQGNPKIASAGMITSGLVNCIFDPILIWGFGPFPAFGIAGAALATSVGRGIGAAMIIIYLASGRSLYRLRPSHFWPKPGIVVEIYRVGVSMAVRVNAASVAQIIQSRTASYFGVIPLAVVGVLSRASSFAFQPAWGIGQGMLPLVGYNSGARKKERVGEIVTKATLAGFLWGFLCFAVAMLFSPQAMSLFGTEPEYLAVAIPAFRIYSLGFFSVGVQTILSFFFQGIGARAIISLAVSSCRQLLFLIPFLLILPNMFGVTGLWAAHPVSDILSIVFTLALTGITFRSLGVKFRLRAFTEPSMPAQHEQNP